MIVVTSTAKNAVGLAGRCVASVREAALRVPCTLVRDRPSVRHVFYAADEATAQDAALAGGAQLDIRLAPTTRQLRNLLDVWNECAPEDIVVHLDGDDTLTPNALEIVAHMYEREDVWLTYGSFVRDDGRLDYQWHGAMGRRYEGPPRSLSWRASHLKTFRAGLVQRIPYTYLQDGAGVLYTTCLDRAVMLPMLDMAGDRYAVASDVLCVYHVSHGAGERGTDRETRDLCEIHARPALPMLESRPY